MKSNILTMTCLVVFCPGLYVRGEQEVKPVVYGPSEATLKRIAVSREKERLEILSKLGKDRSDLQGRLLTELGNAKENDKKFAFVYLMGLYRLDGTIWDLAKIIDLESKMVADDALPLWQQYPVVEALIKIGRPSIRAMLDNIKTAKSKKVTELSVDVIRYVETPAIAKMILQDAIAKEKDPTKARNLQDSLKYLEKK